MTDSAIELITQCLNDAGLAHEFDEGNRTWWVTFNLDGQARPVMLLHPPEDDYIIAASRIDSPSLREGSAIEKLSAKTLATLLRTSSESGFLAKLTYIADGHTYYTTSACSIDGPTGTKLSRSIEACARAAAVIERELESAGSPRSAAPRKARKKR